MGELFGGPKPKAGEGLVDLTPTPALIFSTFPDRHLILRVIELFNEDEDVPEVFYDKSHPWSIQLLIVQQACRSSKHQG